MKKLVVMLAVGAMVFGTFTIPSFAQEGTKDVTVGYDANSIADPENPTDADWSVSIPKSFYFTDTNKTNAEMNVTLNDIKNGGLPVDKKVEISVTSKNAYDLLNKKLDKLAYEVIYNEVMEKTNAKQSIGYLSQDTKTITGTSTLIGDTTKADGLYTDVLTYTVAAAVAK